MASGYARISGKVGVCMVTSGPGATNLITGIATAYMDSIPMVAITGQVPSNLLGRDIFQEVDITGAVAPFSKHSYLVKDANRHPPDRQGGLSHRLHRPARPGAHRHPHRRPGADAEEVRLPRGGQHPGL